MRVRSPKRTVAGNLTASAKKKRDVNPESRRGSGNTVDVRDKLGPLGAKGLDVIQVAGSLRIKITDSAS